MYLLPVYTNVERRGRTCGGSDNRVCWEQIHIKSEIIIL